MVTFVYRADRDEGTVTFPWVQVRFETITDQKGDNQTVAKFVTEERRMHLQSGLVHYGSGKSLNRTEIFEKLVPGRVIVVSQDGEKIDPKYLKTFGDDAIIIEPKDK